MEVVVEVEVREEQRDFAIASISALRSSAITFPISTPSRGCNSLTVFLPVPAPSSVMVRGKEKEDGTRLKAWVSREGRRASSMDSVAGRSY